MNSSLVLVLPIPGNGNTAYATFITPAVILTHILYQIRRIRQKYYGKRVISKYARGYNFKADGVKKLCGSCPACSGLATLFFMQVLHFFSFQVLPRESVRRYPRPCSSTGGLMQQGFERTATNRLFKLSERMAHLEGITLAIIIRNRR